MPLLSLYVCNSLKGLCHEVGLVCYDFITEKNSFMLRHRSGLNMYIANLSRINFSLTVKVSLFYHFKFYIKSFIVKVANMVIILI
jgi:hypothetical protein